VFSLPPPIALPPEPTVPEPPKPKPEQVVIGHSVGGRPIMSEIYGAGEATILIIATIHGNESVGTPLVQKLGEYLLANPEVLEGKRVIVVPVANPDGMEANRRANVRGVDLNRNFPAFNYTATRNHGTAPLSEPESQALHDLILNRNPKLIISIHQPLACIDYDGPADGVARAMSSNSRLPLKKLGSLAGSLGSFAGVSRKTPIVTVEFSRSADSLSAQAMWDRYGRMLLVGICYPQSVPPPIDITTAGTSGNPGTSNSPASPADSALGN
jgi:protein MpaA